MKLLDGAQTALRPRRFAGLVPRLANSFIAVAALAAGGVIVSGCGGSSSSSGVAQIGSTSAAPAPADGTTTQASREDAQEAILAYTRCLRGEGLNIPDPDFSATGGGARLLLRRAGIDPTSAKFRKAQTKCQPLIASIRPQFSPERREQLQEAAVKFAQCMRKNGVNVPDPDFSEGAGPGRGLFGAAGLDPSNPNVQKAMDACRSVFTDAGLGRGPGGPGGPVPIRP